MPLNLVLFPLSALALKTRSSEPTFTPIVFKSDSLFTKKIFKATSLSRFFSAVIPFFSTISFVFLRPAVSKNVTKFPFIWILDSITSRVVPAILEVRATSLFDKWLIKVDFTQLNALN